MNMHLISIENGFIKIAAEGEVTPSDFVPNGKHRMAEVMGDTWASKTVVFDCGHLNGLGSMGVGWLLSCNQSFRSSGGRLVLHSVCPDIAKIIKLLRLESLVPIARDERAALELVRSTPNGNHK